MSNLNSAAKEFVPATFHPAPPVPIVPPPYEYDMNVYSYGAPQIPPSYTYGHPQFQQAALYGQRQNFIPEHHYNQYSQTPKDLYNGGNHRFQNGGGRGPRPSRNNYQSQNTLTNSRENNMVPTKLEGSTLSTNSPAYVPTEAAIAAAIAISQNNSLLTKNDSLDVTNLDNTTSKSADTSTTSTSVVISTDAAFNTTTSVNSAVINSASAAIIATATTNETTIPTASATVAITTPVNTTPSIPVTTFTSSSATTTDALVPVAITTSTAIATSTTTTSTASSIITSTTATTTTTTTKPTNSTTLSISVTPSISTISTASSSSASQGWRRSTTDNTVVSPRVVVNTSTPPPSLSSPNTSQWSRIKSNVIRYDKATIMSLFIRDQLIPEELRGVFLERHLRERVPIDPNISLPSPPKDVEDGTTGTTDETASTDKKNVFRFDPSRFGDPNSDSAKLLKSRSVLNKLTPEKYDKLTKEYMEIGLDTSNELLQAAVNLIVKKAQLEEHFSFMYGNLCKTLCTSWTRSTGVTTDETTMSLGEEFRLALLKSCEEEFNIDNRKKAYEEIAQMDIPEEVKREKYALLRRCYTGHMRFVGEIYKQDLVKANIMRTCLDELLATTEEDKLLCLCKLFAVIGAKLEAYESSKKKGSKIAGYFRTIEGLIAGDQISPLVKYNLMDLCDLRKNKWVVRREELKALTIAEIRGEVNPATVAAAAAAATASATTQKAVQDSITTKEKESADDGWLTVTSSSKKKSSASAPVSTGNTGSTGGQRQAINGKSLYDSKDKDKAKKTTKDVPVVRSGKDASAAVGGMFGILGASGGNSGKDKKEKKKDKDKKEKSSKKTNGSTGKSTKKKELGEKEEDEEEEEVEGVNEDENKESTVVVENVEEDKEDAMPHIEKDVLMKKIKSSVNDLIEEKDKAAICEDLVKEIKELIPLSQMRDFFKYLLEYISEKNYDCYEELCLLLTRLHETAGVFTIKEMQKGLFNFLEVYPDFVCDAPIALVHVPALLGRLLLSTNLDLSAFTLLSYESTTGEPNCLVFIKYLELFFAILDVIQNLSDKDRAKKLYIDSKLPISTILQDRITAENTDSKLKDSVEKYLTYVKSYEE